MIPGMILRTACSGAFAARPHCPPGAGRVRCPCSAALAACSPCFSSYLVAFRLLFPMLTHGMLTSSTVKSWLNTKCPWNVDPRSCRAPAIVRLQRVHPFCFFLFWFCGCCFLLSLLFEPNPRGPCESKAHGRLATRGHAAGWPCRLGLSMRPFTPWRQGRLARNALRQGDR